MTPVLAFYSSTVLSEAGYSNRQALFVSLGFGAVNFLFAFPALFTIDTVRIAIRLSVIIVDQNLSSLDAVPCFFGHFPRWLGRYWRLGYAS